MFGLYIAWTLRRQTKTEFLASNRTQKGQILRRAVHNAKTFATCPIPNVLLGSYIIVTNSCAALPLALNFIAAGECFNAHSIDK